MNNKQIVRILHEAADLLEISGENAFRVRAYRRAARAIENRKQSIVQQFDRLEEIDGIGKGIAQIIREIIETGTTQILEERKKALPAGLIDLLQLSGVGPKTIHTLYRELHITNIEELKQAIQKGKIRTLRGFGPKREQKILEAIQTFEQQPKRTLLSTALLLAEKLQSQLQQLPYVEKAEIAGSLRRKKETIKDIDFIVVTNHPNEVIQAIKTFPEMDEMVQEGLSKIHFLAHHEEIRLPVDIRLVTSDQFASSLHHFTGSSEHNIRIRQIAKQLGYKVNEYGIEKIETGEIMTFPSEADFFAKLQLPYIPPEMREDRGEIEAAQKGELPNLVAKEMIKGDLHTHTLYSDGAHSIEEMARAAMEKGYQYIAITDHSRSLRVASGLTIDELYDQWKEIDRINNQLTHRFRVLKGTEVDILPDGTLDYPNEILAQMDIVIASIHTAFQLDQAAMTKRLIKAMNNPYVHIIGHPTGRLLLRRDPYPLDIEQIFRVAKETGTLLELNANPHRLDLNDQLLKTAKEYGIKFCINTDAHSIEQLSLISFGIGTARRGWLEKNDILNTQSWDQAQKWLKEGTSR